MSDTDSSSSISIDSSIDNLLKAKENNGFLSDFSAEKEFENFCSMNQGNSEGLLLAQELFNKQNNELLLSKEKIEKEGLGEIRDTLDEDIWINEVRISMYEKLGINNNLEKNSSIENFTKGIVDELIIGNFEFAMLVWETKGKIILDGLKQLLTWEGLKALLEGIGSSISDLFVGDAYERGKSTVQLGAFALGGYGVYKGIKSGSIGKIAGGVGLLTSGTHAIKTGAKVIMKGRLDKKKIVEGEHTKNNVARVSRRIEEILPKKHLDVSEMMSQKLLENLQKKKLDDLHTLGSNEYFNSKLAKVSFDFKLKETMTVDNLIGSGSEGGIFEIKGKKIEGVHMVVKIGPPLRVVTRKRNITLSYNPEKTFKNHSDFYTMRQEWLEKAQGEMGLDQRILLDIPKTKYYRKNYALELLEDYTPVATLLKKNFLEKEVSKRSLSLDLGSLDSHQLDILSEKLDIKHFDYESVRLKLLNKKDFELIENFLGYANSAGLYHGDIDFDNLMVHKNNKNKPMYLIDYGDVFDTKKYKAPIKNRNHLTIESVRKKIKEGEKQGEINDNYVDVNLLRKMKRNLVK